MRASTKPCRRTAVQGGLLALLLSTAVAVAQEPPRPWYKGNLHTHSLWSDGNDFPETICDWYKSHGYHFLALSDHNILSEGQKWIDQATVAKRSNEAALGRYLMRFGPDWVETRTLGDVPQVRLKPLNEFRPLFDEPGRFLLIQGEEITDSFQSLPIHLNATNVRDLIKPQGGDSVRATVANNLIAVQQQSQRIGQPMLAHVNHPNFGYALTAEDLAAVLQEQFFEVYNGHPDVNHRGDARRASLEQIWDVANTIRLGEMHRPPLLGLGTDDSHEYFGQRGATPGRGWIMVRARRLTPTALLAAIESGDFYASSGVELSDVQFTEATRTLTIHVQSRPGETYVTEFVGTRTDYDRSSTPIVDAEGREIRTTRRYSADVGRVLAKVEGTRAEYRLTGHELYVRAVVTSSAVPDNPAFDGQRQQAWTQPIGWSAHVRELPPDNTPPSIR